MEIKRVCADISAKNHAILKEYCKNNDITIAYLVNKWIEDNIKK